jgi:hypothetical protein
MFLSFPICILFHFGIINSIFMDKIYTFVNYSEKGKKVIFIASN